MANFIVNETTDDGSGSTTGTLSYAILQANQMAGDDTITLNSDVRVTGVMQTLVNSNITIVGNNYSISGDANGNNMNDNGDVRPLFILSGTVAISDLTITNGRAKGGDSDLGGGGAGMGGGLFIYDGNVSLTNVAFSNNVAQGGNRGVSGLGGGGGGIGGDAGGNGGGGLFGSSTGDEGGYGGNGKYRSGNAGFGSGGNSGSDINGNFGGGGGLAYNAGGNGGFGGGGGFGFYGSNTAGNGGYGGGGATGSYGGYGGFGGGFQGGGAGMGGGIFVRSGSLTLKDTSFTDNTATGGTGENPGQGLGAAIFIMQSTTNTNGNNQGMPTTLANVISNGNLQALLPTYSGNSAADDAGTYNNNNDVYGVINGLSITPLTPIANEGGSNGVFRLTRVNTNGDLTVNLSIDGSSTASTGDYTLSGGSVTVSGSTLTATFTNGQSFLDIDLSAAIDNIIAEADETIKLNLETGAGYTPTNNNAIVTIPGNGTVVTNTNDSGEGSLRQAILNANANLDANTITFAGSVFTDGTPDTITLTSGELDITNALTINGLGASNLSISGNNASAVFVVDDNSSNEIAVAINGLTIKDAFSFAGIGNSENLTINNSTISGNSGFIGGIYNLGTATITNSTISGNSGIAFGFATGGIYNEGTATITNSTISGNSGVLGGIFNLGTATITNSTISGNSGFIGGIFNQGTGTITNSTISSNSGIVGGIANAGTATITNSTISGNTGTDDSGGISNQAILNLSNSTITNNTADSDNNGTGDGGGVFNGGSGTITAQNTIIAGNFDSGNQAPDIAGAVTGNANNLIGSLTGASGSIGTGSDITFASAGITNINQVIGSLANNGGATQTHALVFGSAAINAGNNTLIPSGVTTDQRGITRTIGGTVDIGAYESNFIAPVAANDTATTDENTAVNINVLGNDTDANGDSLSVIKVNGNSVTVGTPITLASGALLTLNANGTLNYNPNGKFESLAAGATASDSFTYTASDNGKGGISTATVNLTINGVNDAPTVANALPDKTTTENSVFNFTVPANTFADVDTSNTLTYTATLDNGNALPSWLTFNATTRNFSGTPVAANVGTISVKVTAKDNSNATVSDIFNLSVTPLNLTGTPNADILTGTASNNTINGLAGNDTITGNKGNDTLTGGSGQDRFVYNLGDGVDTITDFGGVGQGVNPSAAVIAATDTLKFQGAGLTAANLLLTKNGSNLEVSFESVANSPKVILQNFALENLENLRKVNGASVDLGNILFDGQTTVQNSFDVFDANSTQTTISRENIVTFLNDNNNTVNGLKNSNDVINGQGGNDYIDGKSGNDLLRGGAGNDILLGGDGNDILVGGADNDTLVGNSGNDRFVYQVISDKGTTGDTITDFNRNQDKLVLTDLFKSLGYGGTNPISDGYLRFVQSGTSTRVQIDANGGADALSTLATLNNFTATNLVIGGNVLV